MVPKSENENKKQFWSILELVAKNNCVDMLESIVAMPADMVKIFFILTRSLGLYATLLLAPAEGWRLAGLENHVHTGHMCPATFQFLQPHLAGPARLRGYQMACWTNGQLANKQLVLLLGLMPSQAATSGWDKA